MDIAWMYFYRIAVCRKLKMGRKGMASPGVESIPGREGKN